MSRVKDSRMPNVYELAFLINNPILGKLKLECQALIFKFNAFFLPHIIFFGSRFSKKACNYYVWVVKKKRK